MYTIFFYQTFPQDQPICQTPQQYNFWVLETNQESETKLVHQEGGTNGTGPNSFFYKEKATNHLNFNLV